MCATLDRRIPCQISNIVGVAVLADSLDLNRLSIALPSADYDPEIFPGMTVRLERPRIHALLFKSGKARLTGARREQDIATAANVLWTQLRDLHAPVLPQPRCEIVNIVATFVLPTKLDLDALARSLTDLQPEYEPEQFPGVVLRGFFGDTVALLFGSGKGVLAGLKRAGDVDECLRVLIDKCRFDEFAQ